MAQQKKLNSTKTREAWRVNGILQSAMVRCGKTNCKCEHGLKHGPYWNLVWRDGRKSKRRYVKADNLNVVRSALKRGHEWGNNIREKRWQTRSRQQNSIAYLNDFFKGRITDPSGLREAAESVRDGLETHKLVRLNDRYLIEPDYRSQFISLEWWVDNVLLKREEFKTC